MKSTKLLQKIIKSTDLDQTFLFIVLIGLLPVMADYSLFSLLGSSILDLFDDMQLDSYKSIIYYLPLAVLPIGLWIVWRKKEPIRLMGLIPYLIPIVVFLFFSRLKEGNAFLTTTIEVVHLIAHKIAFFYFIFNGHIRSKVFAVFSGIVLILLGWKILILFLFFTVLFRFLYLAILQNVQIFSKIGLVKVLQLTLKTFLYWSPMLLFIIPGEIFTSKLYHKSIDSLYQHTFITCSDEENKYKRDQFEKDLTTALDIEFEKIRKGVTKKTVEAFKGLKKAQDNFPKVAGQAFDAVVPEDLPAISETFKLERKPFWHVKSTVKDIAKEGLNDGYTDGVDEQRDDYMKEIYALKAKTGNPDSLQAMTINQVNLRVDNIKTATYATIMGTFKSILFLNIISNLILWFLIIKSFLYVFARVAFTADSDAYVTLFEEDFDMPTGALEKCAHTYTIPSSYNENFFISRVFEPSGRAPKYTIPQWNKAVFGRLGAKAYAMNKVTMKDREGDVHFRAMGGNEFVEWDIQEGEVVIFDFKRFVGMSEGIQLSAIVSLRLTSLLMGKIIFTVAKGPGKLVLMTEGKPIIGSEEKSNASIPVNRIVAWQKNVHFHVESELNIVDVFLSGIYLKKQEADPVLIDADSKGRAKRGIVSFIRKFLMPF